MAYCPGLAYFAENLPNVICEKSIDKPCFLFHFGALVNAMRTLKSVTPAVFFNNLAMVCSDMIRGNQQDAHEYLFALLNTFDDECARAFSAKRDYYDTAIHCLFGSKLKGTRECDLCSRFSDIEAHLLDITLNLDSDSIEECFQSFLNPPKAEHVCEKCQQNSHFQESLKFSKVPEILVVTMMRFGVDGKKSQKTVRFGFDLDLSVACINEEDGLFELFAVIVHDGPQIHRGHYMCYVKCGNGIWYLVDDLRVVKGNRHSILNSNPYMLFYRRKEKVFMEPVYVRFGVRSDGDKSG
jgi:ubiquitin C-terminal hydrolase